MFRRRFVSWAAIALVGALATLAVWAFWLEPASLTVTEERIALPFSRRGALRVAILTDLHVGSPFNGLDNLRKIVDLTNESRPDLICILGDLVSQGVRGGRFVPPEQSGLELSRLKATYGVFGVLGNHDGRLGHDRVAGALTRNGVQLLEEQSRLLETSVGTVWLAGISDLWTGTPDIDAALSAIPDDGAPVILMMHNPDTFPSVPARVALTVAGHTHGGQVRFPFIGAPVIPSRYGQRFAAGHVVEDGRQLFVATGVGTSILPVRFRVPPAIALLTLTRD